MVRSLIPGDATNIRPQIGKQCAPKCKYCSSDFADQTHKMPAKALCEHRGGLCAKLRANIHNAVS